MEHVSLEYSSDGLRVWITSHFDSSKWDDSTSYGIHPSSTSSAQSMTPLLFFELCNVRSIISSTSRHIVIFVASSPPLAAASLYLCKDDWIASSTSMEVIAHFFMSCCALETIVSLSRSLWTQPSHDNAFVEHGVSSTICIVLFSFCSSVRASSLSLLATSKSRKRLSTSCESSIGPFPLSSFFGVAWREPMLNET